ATKVLGADRNVLKMIVDLDCCECIALGAVPKLYSFGESDQQGGLAVRVCLVCFWRVIMLRVGLSGLLLVLLSTMSGALVVVAPGGQFSIWRLHDGHLASATM